LLYLIAARAENNVIGRGPDIPWKVRGEQKLFREITLGNTLIMGRKTFDSIGKPLPGRDTVIVTRQSCKTIQGCPTAASLTQAAELANRCRGDTFVAGGGEIYRQSINMAAGIHLTTIHTSVEGDIYFPEFNMGDYTVVEQRDFESNINYTYQFLRRLTGAQS